MTVGDLAGDQGQDLSWRIAREIRVVHELDMRREQASLGTGTRIASRVASQAAGSEKSVRMTGASWGTGGETITRPFPRLKLPGCRDPETDTVPGRRLFIRLPPQNEASTFHIGKYQEGAET